MNICLIVHAKAIPYRDFYPYDILNKLISIGKTNLTDHGSCDNMRIAERFVLTETWFWRNNIWKGEIILGFHYRTPLDYQVLGFDAIYAEWVCAVKEVEENNLTSLEVFQPMFESIYQEFKYYKSALGELFDSLSTEKRERFKNGIESIWGQYNLLLEFAWNSDEDLKVLLDFLEELPGRMSFILRTLNSQESQVVAPEPKQFSPTGAFLEGKKYKKLEETGKASLFFCKAAITIKRGDLMSRERYSKFIEGIDLQQIFLASLNCSRLIDLEGDHWLVDLRSDFRLIDSGGSGEIRVEARLKASANHQKKQMVVVDATFMLIYHSASEIDFDDEIKEIFLKSNPPLNIWPYAREIISSMTTRMGLPPLIIEPYKVY